MSKLPEFRRVKVELLQPGDIVLTSAPDKTSRMIRGATFGAVSHAMLCVQNGSTIDSTYAGVQASNIQRELYGPKEKVFVLRLREPLSAAMMSGVIDFARSEIGARYSKEEAVRSVLPGSKPRTRQQFCSRLVARAFASIGVNLVNDPDYCTPEAVRKSRLLVELPDMTEAVSEAERVAWSKRPNPVLLTQEAHNAILEVARQLDPSVENFNDVDGLIQMHPEWDDTIAEAYVSSGFLDLWKVDFRVNSWHYDLSEMNAMTNSSTREDLRAYCASTIREFHTGGLRYAVNLVHYQRMLNANGRRTNGLLVKLYETLVRNDEIRRNIARQWLEQHHPGDADALLERITPHSEHWFSIVDRVEPKLGIIARASIQAMRSPDVCSSCGDDPAQDFRLINQADAMPGVPSLRLCTDCVGIRRSYGEILEPM